MSAPNILVIAGTAQSGSTCERLAGAITKALAMRGALNSRLSLQDYKLPWYDGEDDMHPAAARFAAQMAGHHGVVLVNPQYNGSVSPLLLNALNWAQLHDVRDRGFRESSFSRQVFALAACAKAQSGGTESLSHLRDFLVAAGGDVVSAQLALCEQGDIFAEDESLLGKDPGAALRNLTLRVIEQAGQYARD